MIRLVYLFSLSLCSCCTGTFGSSTGLGTAACSGPCPLGNYCPEKTVDPSANKCQAGYAHTSRRSTHTHIARVCERSERGRSSTSALSGDTELSTTPTLVFCRRVAHIHASQWLSMRSWHMLLTPPKRHAFRLAPFVLFTQLLHAGTTEMLWGQPRRRARPSAPLATSAPLALLTPPKERPLTLPRAALRSTAGTPPLTAPLARRPPH